MAETRIQPEQRVASIEAAIAAVQAQGQPVTYKAVYAQVGGSRTFFSAYWKQRHAQAQDNAGAAVAVAVVDHAAPPRVSTSVYTVPRQRATPPLVPALPLSPLDRAKQAVQQAHAATEGLVLRHQSLKDDLKQVEQRRLTLQASHPRRRSAAALEQERLLLAIETEWAAVEAARAAVAEDAEEAYHAQQVATEHVQALERQARQALAAMRTHQQSAQALVDPWRQDVLAEARAAEQRLAAVVGPAEAARLAADPTAQPSWLRG
jgi:hypothetical protein